MPGERNVRLVRNSQRDLGGRLGRDVQAREKAGVKARGRTVGGRRVVSSTQSSWLADSYRKAHPLIGALQRHVVEENDANQAARSVGWIHPSAVSKPDWCPRASWYEVVGEHEPIPESIGSRMAHIFSEGREIHRKYQRWFREMGILYGYWRCRSCNYQWWDTCPTVCHMCLDEFNIEYVEVPIRDEDLMLDGAADALVSFEERLRLIEIKSIGLRSIELEYPKLYTPYRDGVINLDALWARIQGPFPAHIRQASLYFYVLGQMEIRVDDIIFIYEFKANQQVKAFTIAYDPGVVKPILRGVREVVEAVETRRQVRRPVWADGPGNKTCKVCPYRKACWSSFNDE